MRAGDILVMSNGEYVVVEQVQHELLESPVRVYNFEVEEFHTYFVGDTSVLVHNTCVVGKPHGSLKHKRVTKSVTRNLKKSGEYSKIYLNKSLKSAGLNGRYRPDIMAKRVKDGVIEIYEVASKSQAKGWGKTILQNKMQAMQAANQITSVVKNLIPWR